MEVELNVGLWPFFLATRGPWVGLLAPHGPAFKG